MCRLVYFRSHFPKLAFHSLLQGRWDQFRFIAEVSASQLYLHPIFPPLSAWQNSNCVKTCTPEALSLFLSLTHQRWHTHTPACTHLFSQARQASFSCQTRIEALISCSASLPSVRPNSTVTQLDFTASFEMLAVYVCVLVPQRTGEAELCFEQSLFSSNEQVGSLRISVTGFYL